jgi:hypothetical protein
VISATDRDPPRMTGMSHYEHYLSRGGAKRLGFGTKPDGEIHPLKALAIVFLVLGGIPFLASIISPVTGAIYRWFFD